MGAKFSTRPGLLLQSDSRVDTSVATTVNTIPLDDTVPLNTEGEEFMTLTFTPKKINSKIMIDVTWIGSHSAAVYNIIVALFVGTNCLKSAVGSANSANQMLTINFRAFYDTASGPVTFRVRAGSPQAGTLTFNGFGGNRKLGGSLGSRIDCLELSAYS